jgi:hypothetical protein
MVLVECVMDKNDAPFDLILGGHTIADTDYAARWPPLAVNARFPLPLFGGISGKFLARKSVRLST